MPKVAVQLRSHHEGDALKRSLEDPTIKAATLIAGMLLDLPHASTRLRVLRFVEAAIMEPPPLVERSGDASLRLHDADANGDRPTTTGE